MNKLFSILLATFGWQTGFAISALPFYEPFPFSYGDGTIIGTGVTGTNWDIGNTGSSLGAVITNTAALSHPGLISSNSLGLLIYGTPASTRNKAATFTAQTLGSSNPAVYASFLLNVQQVPANNRLFAALSSSASGTGPSGVIGIWLDPANRLMLSKNSSSSPSATQTTPLTAGTHLIVVRYLWNAGTSDDEVNLWVDPEPLGAAEGAVPAAEISTSSGSDVATIQSFWILHPTTTSVAATLRLDEIRVGPTWASVTPPDGPPAPPPTPVITEALLNSQGMILRGTNGPASGVYQVLTSTSVTVPPATWPSIAAHSFDESGNFDSTNPVSPGQAHQFFRLLVGGILPSAPGITNQPQSQTNVQGQTTVFSVLAGGTAPLDYFWFFNANTPVGGNNSSLTIPNVQTNQAGAYWVVVTNSFGNATSAVATLTVLVPPNILTQPTNLTVNDGDNATFTAAASGSAPLRYQWFFNTNTPVANATNATLTLNSVQIADAGGYSVLVTNGAGSATSLVATLTVLAPPAILQQPADQTVAVSNSLSFNVMAVGTAPLHYQWYFNTNTPVGSNSNAYMLVSAQFTNAGSYAVVVTNAYGSITSSIALLTVTPPPTNLARYNLMGFAQAVTGGGQIAESNSAYRKVTNALDFITALANSSVKVIEVTADLDLGYTEAGAAVQAFSIFRQHATPLLHPRLLQTGVSLIDIQNKNGLTIFSANGATIRHANLNIKNSANVIVRNLKFDELWEWDESSKGDYDRNDWDFLTLGNGGGSVSNIWIDHCTFTKAYDGICDMKGGCFNITFSWNKYVGDDGASNTNSFVRQQINALEQSPGSYAMYNFLRTRGFSVEDIVSILQGHDKTHLIGATSLNPENAQHAVTFHHQWYMNPWDRLPRLRAGNVHNFNIYVDDTQGLAAKRLRDARKDAMSPADQNTLNNTYNFQVFLNGSISTEDGAILVEKSAYIDCLTPLRNNQTDPSNAVYTGKIMALDSIYHFDNADTTSIDYRGDSTNAPGSTYFGPVQAPVIPFSWNLPGNALPYSYTMDDPSQLLPILSDPTGGAGAGVLSWTKTNWLKTSY